MSNEPTKAMIVTDSRADQLRAAIAKYPYLNRPEDALPPIAATLGPTEESLRHTLERALADTERRLAETEARLAMATVFVIGSLFCVEKLATLYIVSRQGNSGREYYHEDGWTNIFRCANYEDLSEALTVAQGLAGDATT